MSDLITLTPCLGSLFKVVVLIFQVVMSFGFSGLCNSVLWLLGSQLVYNGFFFFAFSFINIFHFF